MSKEENRARNVTVRVDLPPLEQLAYSRPRLSREMRLTGKGTCVCKCDGGIGAGSGEGTSSVRARQL